MQPLNFGLSPSPQQRGLVTALTGALKNWTWLHVQVKNYFKYNSKKYSKYLMSIQIHAFALFASNYVIVYAVNTIWRGYNGKKKFEFYAQRRSYFYWVPRKPCSCGAVWMIFFSGESNRIWSIKMMFFGFCEISLTFLWYVSALW